MECALTPIWLDGSLSTLLAGPLLVSHGKLERRKSAALAAFAHCAGSQFVHAIRDIPRGESRHPAASLKVRAAIGFGDVRSRVGERRVASHLLVDQHINRGKRRIGFYAMPPSPLRAHPRAGNRMRAVFPSTMLRNPITASRREAAQRVALPAAMSGAEASFDSGPVNARSTRIPPRNAATINIASRTRRLKAELGAISMLFGRKGAFQSG